ncbi:MAG: S8 family serine peptidase [Actinobacteria bacterium]|nr:S8 family serine peptidase [Actinomycetota bacterium]
MSATEGDPYRDPQWGLDQVRAEDAWPATVGSGQVIAVVDGGIDLDHPDLAGRVIGGTTFVDCDDRVHGCRTGDYRDGEPGGDLSFGAHGTHVAGIAAATADNGVGVAGVAPGARILSVKTIRASNGEGTFEDVAAGVRWAVANGADVINLSLGADPGVQALALAGAADEVRDAAREAAEAGVVVIAAAGNESASVCAEPASAPAVVCVVATDRQEQRAAYSNLAVSEDLNVVAAPGGAAVLTCARDILSTVPPDLTGTCGPTAGYDHRAGTSMAAPHVSGLAALLRAQGRSAGEVVDILMGTARTPGTGTRGTYTATYGYGIVDAEAAVAEPPSQPVVRRAAGADRVATAAEVSEATHHRADTVVLARADEYADALAGAPLAVHLRAALLTTAPGGLSTAAAREIERLEARRAVLLGGPGALSPRVEQDLLAMDLDVDRIAGGDRYETAARIAAELPPTGEVFVVEGHNADPRRGWPDALSASGLAASLRAPILLTTRDVLPEPTAGALDAGTDVTIVGGPVSVSPAVHGALDARSATVRRLAGADRYATAVAVAREALARGRRPSTTWLATGHGFADGLVAGAAAGTEDGVLLLIDGLDLDNSPSAVTFLREHASEVYALRLAGGPAVITGATERRVRSVVAGS